MKAVVWILLPDLSPKFFASKLLMTTASVVGKPIAIDKATQESSPSTARGKVIFASVVGKPIAIDKATQESRPSTARVKVILDLGDKLPKCIRLQYLDSKFYKMLEFQVVNVSQACDSGQRTSAEADNEQTVTVEAQAEKSGPQLMCKEALKEDGMAVVSRQTAFQAIVGDQYDDIIIIDKSHKQGTETVNTSSKELLVSSRQENSSRQDKVAQFTAVNFTSIGTQILENMNPLHALAGNLFTRHATTQFKGNTNATEK
ncbi:hypothetical protein HAX54_041672 [Datura stramonium]|uniref:Uncharacterized protein n=1 Tax=Datura stramonium TaxID=4076 RepID=A0ABS8VXH5_DATST|nr:hypothetical protein [Datura stramonium]